jgi:cell division septation protein DedD
MAGNGKRGGDRVLESRHLIGLFLGVVLLCGVFFTLGYVMGRTQYGGSVHAETITRPPAPVSVEQTKDAQASPAATPAPSEWDFYSKKANPQLADSIPPKPAPTVAEDPALEQPAVEAPPAARPALIPAKTHAAAPLARAARPSIVLQIAALRHESDAVEMARLLQRKHFPSFVSAPLAGDTLYRVQVGPYTDERAADAAKAALDHAGFKAIIKR